MHVAAEHGHVDVIRTLAESWVLCWIHKTPEMVGFGHSHRRGQRRSGGGLGLG